MQSNTDTNKILDISPKGFILIIFILIVAIIFFLIQRREIEELKKKLIEKEAELEALKRNIEEAKKLWNRCVRTKKVMKWALRVSIVVTLFALNYVYIRHSYNKPVLKDILEAISTLNAALLFFASTVVFLRYGNFFEIRQTFHSFQLMILSVCFGKRQETIEVILQLRELNKNMLASEIRDTRDTLAKLEATHIKPEPTSLNVAVQSRLVLNRRPFDSED